MTDDELLEQVTADIQTIQDSGAVLPFQLTPAEAFQLLSALQLALRHPGVTAAEHTGAFVRALAENIGRRLSRTPALTEIVRRGFEPAYDTSTPAARASSSPDSSEAGGAARRPAPARTAKGRK